jgi:nucleotide-binding universal stress UspA family protein
MYKKILVAVDGSPTSALGLKEAVKLARDQSARLVLLHIVDELAVTRYPEVVYYAGDLIGSLREAGARILAKAEAQVRRSGLRPQAILIDSRGRTVAEAIVGQARKLKADVIVLGTHGRRGLNHLLLGSDAESVVRAAPMPVLLVRGRAARPSARSR